MLNITQASSSPLGTRKRAGGSISTMMRDSLTQGQHMLDLRRRNEELMERKRTVEGKKEALRLRKQNEELERWLRENEDEE